MYYDSPSPESISITVIVNYSPTKERGCTGSLLLSPACGGRSHSAPRPADPVPPSPYQLYFSCPHAYAIQPPSPDKGTTYSTIMIILAPSYRLHGDLRDFTYYHGKRDPSGGTECYQADAGGEGSFDLRKVPPACLQGRMHF